MNMVRWIQIFRSWRLYHYITFLMGLLIIVTIANQLNLPYLSFKSSNKPPILPPLESWRHYSSLHGHSIEVQTHHSKPTCHDFFGLWPSDCVDKYEDLNDKMKTISAQMKLMKSTFTLITTASQQCTFHYPHIEVLTINTTETLVQCGLTSTLPIIATWKKTRYTRISDILRICLSYQYHKSYIDTDIHFLSMNKTIFEYPYVGTAVWSNNKNALEITNAAYCLPTAILQDMIQYMYHRILSLDNAYFYTELGPSMFHNVLLNRYPIHMYSQNHPADPNIHNIVRGIHQYGHMQLHLTGHVRKGNPSFKFSELVNYIRLQAKLPLLTYES